MGLCVFVAHTDLTDLTDFFVGGKSHGLCGGVHCCLQLNMPKACPYVLMRLLLDHKADAYLLRFIFLLV